MLCIRGYWPAGDLPTGLNDLPAFVGHPVGGAKLKGTIVVPAPADGPASCVQRSWQVRNCGWRGECDRERAEAVRECRFDVLGAGGRSLACSFDIRDEPVLLEPSEKAADAAHVSSDFGLCEEECGKSRGLNAEFS